jgi:hypothetical protein
MSCALVVQTNDQAGEITQAPWFTSTNRTPGDTATSKPPGVRLAFVRLARNLASTR